jgi:hypothetical protein
LAQECPKHAERNKNTIKVLMILRLLCIWLVFYLLLSSLMHGTMNMKFISGMTMHQKQSKLVMNVRLLYYGTNKCEPTELFLTISRTS